MDLWDCMVVVSRWYGGQKLGPRRFAVINQAARDVFVKAGLVPEPGAGKKKGHNIYTTGIMPYPMRSLFGHPLPAP
ncbi:impact family protein [Magnaporthiopsis poae ATCC 64411]|uniref:Impact family protein n=1 Tax=Magnaporthiopsis poae (strain ATCC 64411 / 73-15) TaxID=644358 RepID=A0A0C4E900_MAGP6|nr:impact family protein [Magnaporthiopsis poae ATCC 64411]